MIKDLPWLVWIFLRLMFWKLWGVEPRRLNQNFGLKGNARFMSAIQAAELIKSGDTIIVAGLGASGWASAMFKAVALMFEKFSYPRNLTILAPAGQGGRGKMPWSIDDWAKFPGLAIRLFSGHLETFRNTLKMASTGSIEVHCIPQGAFCRLIGKKADGLSSFSTAAGIGTFADPRVGMGTCIVNADKQWVEVKDGLLEYTCPEPDVAIICATFADPLGNIYVKNSALLGEMKAAIKATKLNGGKVIVQVGSVVSQSSNVYIKADLVDAIVVRPETPQILCFTQRRPFKALIRGAQYNVRRALKIIAFLNKLAKLTPKRGPVDWRVARAAASVLTQYISTGAKGNVGVGLPEQVAAALAVGGVMPKLNIVVESGPLGGVAASGALFGSVINPEDLLESCEVFHLIEKNGLDFALLGGLEVGPLGDVNLSRRGLGVDGTVGPGGAIHIMYGTRVIMFVMRLRDNKTGQLRFVDKIQEVTFSAAEALKAGKKVFYATDCGVFRLTEKGLKLIYRFSDFSIKQIRELLPFAQVGDNAPVFGRSVATGVNFFLSLPS